MEALDHLLGAKRDHDADDDDFDFTGELTPAVQRFWQVEVHTRPPGEPRLTDAVIAAMGR